MSKQIKIRSQKGNLIRRTTPRYRLKREVINSNEQLSEAKDFLAAVSDLAAYAKR